MKPFLTLKSNLLSTKVTWRNGFIYSRDLKRDIIVTTTIVLHIFVFFKLFLVDLHFILLAGKSKYCCQYKGPVFLISKSVGQIFDSLRQYRKWSKEPQYALFCILLRSPRRLSKKRLDCNIPSWVFWRKLNLSDGFDSFRFLKFLNLKGYIIETKLIGWNNTHQFCWWIS